MSRHYIRLDTNNNIIKGFSTDFEQQIQTDICINEDGERQFEINRIVNPTLKNIQGIYLYEYIDNEVVTKANEVIQQEIYNLPIVVQPPTIENLQAQIFNLTSQLISGGAL